MKILLKKDMDCSLGTTFLSALKRQVLVATHTLMGLSVVVCLAACAAPAPVTVPAEPSASEPVPTQMEPKIVQSDLPTIAYTIQVGAFTTTDRAARFALRLKNQGLDAYYFIDGDGLYKVRFERFDSKDSARRRAMELQSFGRIEGFYIVEPGASKPESNPQAALRENIVKTAKRFIGTPYRWGGESAGRGFDCSGLTMTVYRLNGLDLPRNSRSQFRVGTPIRRNALRRGDLVFFSTNGRNRVSHVGVYTGQGNFIHAPGRGKRIRTSSLANGYFSRRYMGGRRYF